MYGWAPDSAFWAGSQRYPTDLLAAFVAYYQTTAVLGAGVHLTLNDREGGLAAPAARFLGPRVAYRGGWGSWSTAPLGPSRAPEYPYEYEVLAVASCWWEHRLDARWVGAPSSVDNFLVSTAPGESVVDALARVDPRVSGLELPMVVPHTNRTRTSAAELAPLNVLQRWPFLGPELEYGNDRTIPLANPRHATHAWVHYNDGRLPAFGANLRGREAFYATGLHVVHLLGLSRPALDKGAGREDAAYAAAGEALALAQAAQGVEAP